MQIRFDKKKISVSGKLFYRYNHRNARLFPTALFVVVKDRKQSTCPSNGDCWIEITVYLYDGLSPRAKKERGRYTDKGRSTNYILIEKCRVQNRVSHMSSFVYGWIGWKRSLLCRQRESRETHKKVSTTMEGWGQGVRLGERKLSIV